MYSRKKRAAKKLSLQSARTESGCPPSGQPDRFFPFFFLITSHIDIC